MNSVPHWSTACLDWEERIVEGRSLIPFDPLFPKEAALGLDIFRSLTLVDVAGRPTMGEVSRPWILDFVGTLFGSYDAENGRRLINEYLLDIAKKNAKSTLAAGVMLTALMRNWRDSGEFYILAPSKEVADNSFFPARDMVRADNDLHTLLHVREDFRTIKHRNTNAFLKVVAADSETVGGKKTIGLFVDELWQFGKKANAGPMIREAKGGLASRPEGFVIYATTKPDGPPAGVYAEKLEYFRGVRDGTIDDPNSLALIYEHPQRIIDSGEYKLPKYFYIPNPNLGASVDEGYLLKEQAKAEREGKSSVVNFEAKHLNVQPSMALRSDSWAGAVVWGRGLEKGLTLGEILRRSEVITIGVDGGGLDDLLGVGVIGRCKKTKRWLGWAHALISDVGIERRKANIEYYDRFERQGDLTKFVYIEPPEGEEQQVVLPPNIQYIVDLVEKVQRSGLLAQVGVDAAGIGAIVDALAGIGITQDAESLDAVRQGIGLMGAVKTIEIKLADYSFRHGESEMMAWCVANLRVIPTRTAAMVARDEAGFGKVDPIMALFNAAHLMALNPEAGGRSIYDVLADAEPAQSAEAPPLSPDEEAAILSNPKHPRFEDVRDAFNARLAAKQDDEEFV